MSKNILICCDGTGNEINAHLSNVLKLYRIAGDSDSQSRYYDPGVGTIADDNPWSKNRMRLRTVFGLATGQGIDENILDAYQFLIDSYQPGDRIFLFGFSRGAYTIQALAGLIYQIGVLKPEQKNLASYALTSYRRVTSGKNVTNAWRFSKVTNSRRVPIHFMGLWDSVGSVLVPKRGFLSGFTLQILPYTDANPAIKFVRQAAAIDERRRMFRLHRWKRDQAHQPDPFVTEKSDQNFQEVWFAGVHSDIGGGYPEKDSALAKFPLKWIVDQAKEHGMETNVDMYHRLIHGNSREGSDRQYSAPDPRGKMHDSMTGLWKVLEYLPKKLKWREWQDRKSCFEWWYWPRKEPRYIEAGALVHQSVQDRRDQVPDYMPVNIPEQHELVE